MTQHHISQMHIRKVSELEPLDCFEDYHFGYQQQNNNYSTAFDFNNQNQSKQNRKVRVSEKLTKNKLKRIEIELQKQQEKIEILNQKRQRFQELNQFLRQKNLLSEQAKQNNIHKNDPNIICKQKNKKYEFSPQKQLMITQKIDKHRAKANQLRETYAFRIYKKNKQRNDKVLTNKKQIDQKEYNKFQKVHFKQWHNYEKKIIQRNQNFNQTGQVRASNPPDYLYQKYKQKQNKIQKMLEQKMQNYMNSKQNDNSITPVTMQLRNNNQTITKSNKNISTKQINMNKNNSQNQLNRKNKQSLPMIQIYRKSKIANDKQKQNQQKIQNQTINTKKSDKKVQGKSPLQKVYHLQFFGLHNDSYSNKQTQTRPRKQITQKLFDQMKEYVKNTQSLQMNYSSMLNNNTYLDQFQNFLAKLDFVK